MLMGVSFKTVNLVSATIRFTVEVLTSRDRASLAPLYPILFAAAWHISALARTTSLRRVDLWLIWIEENPTHDHTGEEGHLGKFSAFVKKWRSLAI